MFGGGSREPASYSPIPFRSRSLTDQSPPEAKQNHRNRSPSASENKSQSPNIKENKFFTIKSLTVSQLCKPYENRVCESHNEQISLLQEQLTTLRSKCVMLENNVQLKEAELQALKDYVVKEKNKVATPGEVHLKLATAEAENQRLTRMIDNLVQEKKAHGNHIQLQNKIRQQEEEFRAKLKTIKKDGHRVVDELRRSLDHSQHQLSRLQEEMKQKNNLLQTYESQNLDLTRKITELHTNTLKRHNQSTQDLMKIEKRMKEHWAVQENKVIEKIRKTTRQFEERFKLLTANETKLAKMIYRQAESSQTFRCQEKSIEQLKFTKRQLVTEIHDLRQQRQLYLSSSNV